MTSPPYAPRRIVSLQPSATVILESVGQLDRLVACTKYCVEVCPQAAHGRTVVDDSWTADAAQIVAAKPDLVIAAVPYQEKAVSEILKAGARFLGLAPRSLADIYTDIMLIAGAVGAGQRGEQAVRTMQDEITQIRTRAANAPKPRVFCEEWGKPLIASQPWVAELVDAAGGEPVAEAGKPIAPERVLELDPEVVVAAWCGAGDRVPLAKMVSSRGWQQMSAVHARRVYCIRDEYLNTPAPTLLDGLRALAAAIHPELFSQPAGLKCITDVPGEARLHPRSVI